VPQCAPDENGQCHPGFNLNGDDRCFPDHPNGCPEGYHSHEDDETGGYIVNPDYPECGRIDRICAEHPAYPAAVLYRLAEIRGLKM
jgi:hypothetical protein